MYPCFPYNELPPDLLCPSPSERLLYRRASHAGNLGQAGRHKHVSPIPTQPSFLNVPRSRSRGSSLPDNISSSELYRLRNFATSGKRVINKGDSYRSRNSSVNSSRSRYVWFFETEIPQLNSWLLYIFFFNLQNKSNSSQFYDFPCSLQLKYSREEIIKHFQHRQHGCSLLHIWTQ